MRIAAQSIDLECLVVDSFARLVHPPHTQLTNDDVDFVLSLHFETPKRFDIFSFVTLWNPLQYYHEWGYRKFTRHLLTHDDFLSCDSPSGDDHVMRSISNHSAHAGPLFHLYPTLSGPILEPTLGDKQLFYVGMNWERSIKRPERHVELLRLLDQSGDLRLSGPKVYGGVEVWPWFKSYVGPMPFDGVSVVRLINHAGISLVLSSLTPLEIAPIHFFERRPDGSLKRRMPTGKVIDEVIGSLVQEDYVCVVASRERLFSHHLCSLLRTLQDFPEAGCAWSDALAPQLNDIDQPALCDDPEVRNLAGQTIGFGRYLFRMSAIEERIHHALPYLDSLAVHLLFGTSKSVPTRRCMLIAAETERVGELDNGMSIDLEREILIDISPKVFATIAHERIEQTRLPQPLEPALPPQPAALSLLGMTPEERRNSRSSWRTAFRFPLL